jgi:hypothetical protein
MRGSNSEGRASTSGPICLVHHCASGAVEPLLHCESCPKSITFSGQATGGPVIVEGDVVMLLLAGENSLSEVVWNSCQPGVHLHHPQTSLYLPLFYCCANHSRSLLETAFPFGLESLSGCDCKRRFTCPCSQIQNCLHHLVTPHLRPKVLSFLFTMTTPWFDPMPSPYLMMTW